MQKQKGNFLLQALLALTLVFAFIPFFAHKISSYDTAAQMYATTKQVETVYNVARVYIREMKDVLPYSKTELMGDKLVKVLESFGMPIGFVPETSFNQKISMVIDKTEDAMTGYIVLAGGNLSKMQMAELARRIGFYAKIKDGAIHVTIPVDIMYSDIVTKKETGDNVGFLSELDMNDNSIDKIGVLFARNGTFETAQFGTFVLYGVENGRNEKNTISDFFAHKSVFQSADGGAALSVSRGDLNVESASLRTIARFGSPVTFESNSASVYDFSMSEGHVGFVGPSDWLIRGALRADNFSFTTDRLDINSYLNATRGQDVYVDPDSLEYNLKSGVDVKNMYAANITLRDQTSYGLLNGQSGAVIIDIRPAGTSLLPDVYIDSINNDSFEIIADPKDTEGLFITCKDIIDSLDGVYNPKSLAQNIICQYVFWQRLEKRIDIKQCMMNGRNDCI